MGTGKLNAGEWTLWWTSIQGRVEIFLVAQWYQKQRWLAWLISRLHQRSLDSIMPVTLNLHTLQAIVLSNNILSLHAMKPWRGCAIQPCAYIGQQHRHAMCWYSISAVILIPARKYPPPPPMEDFWVSTHPLLPTTSSFWKFQFWFMLFFWFWAPPPLGKTLLIVGKDLSWNYMYTLCTNFVLNVCTYE